jgi:PAS domain-containing protein
MALLRESKNPSQVARSPISASDWISGLGLKRTLWPKMILTMVSSFRHRQLLLLRRRGGQSSSAKSKFQMKRKSAILETTSESAKRLSDLLTLSYEPMLAWRLDGAIEFWNSGAERLYGFASDEALGRSSHSLLQTKFQRKCRTG